MALPGTPYGFSMHDYLAGQATEPDDDSTSSTMKGKYPAPVIPPVYTNYLIIDIADARNAESDYVKEWQVAPTQPPTGRVENGTGNVYRATLRGFWIPTPEDEAVALQKEYWLTWSALRTGHYGFPARPRPQFPLREDTTDATRTRLTPIAVTYIINEPLRVEAGFVSISSASGPISMRQVRYTASGTFDGVGNLVITLGAGHGVIVGDVMHPYAHDVSTMQSSFGVNKPHGSIVTAIAATTVTVVCAGPSVTTTLKVVVGSRWVRIPMVIESHHATVTNHISV